MKLKAEHVEFNLCVTFYTMPSALVTPRKFTFTGSRATNVGCDPYCFFALGSVGSQIMNDGNALVLKQQGKPITCKA